MTFREFWQPLTSIYPEGEARWIGRFVFEEKYGLTHADLLMGSETAIDEAEVQEVQRRLLAGEPVQYVVGKTLFCGRQLHVAPGVLIPRPETEELCRWCLEDVGDGWQGSILDIGTGSGCIACTLAAALPQAAVEAWDVSSEALRIARENANRTSVHVSFRQVDVLSVPPAASPCWDLIVSNPPYVCEQEKDLMAPHVVEHEPSVALFVPDDDALLFYRVIGAYALTALRPGGRLFFELNERHADAVAALLRSMGFGHVEKRQDQYDKDRFIRVCR